MSAIWAIAWTQWRAFYLAPAGWIVPALFLAGSGLVFMQSVFRSGQPAELVPVFGFNALFLMIAAPAVTMAAICQERHRGTLALVQASPVGPFGLVCGKWLGCLGVLVVLLLPTMLQVVLLEAYGRPDAGAIAAGYLGLLLLCGALVATGLAVSAVAGSQAVAFLVTCLGWIGLAVVLEVALPTVLGPTWRTALGEADPLRRLQDFSSGLVDSANVIYFLSIMVAFVVGAAMLLRTDGRLVGRVIWWLGLVTALIAVNVLVLSPSWRYRVDATKSRAYSLSPRTLAMMDQLPGAWRITMALAEGQSDPAMLRQIDEVLARFQAASPAITTQRIDPTRPDQLLDWEALVLDLDRGQEEALQVWQSAIDAARATFGDLIEFAGMAAGPWRMVQRDDMRPLQSVAAAMAILAAQGDQVVDAVDEAMETAPHQPLADLEAARAILQQGLSSWAVELDAASRLVSTFDDGLPSEVDRTACQAMATQLAQDADRLARLEPLPRASLGRRLAEGEAAVVSGPMGAHVIPASQIVPRRLKADSDGQITFDQRFRGEQIISAAIRSLLDDVQPRVVFVHDSAQSVLQGGQDQTDVAGVADMLRASRIVVEEWLPHRDPQPPEWTEGPTSWVVLPPMRRSGPDASSGEAALRRATERLIERGEGVLVSLYPSPAPSRGQADPWATMIARYGIEVDTSQVLLRDMPERAAPMSGMELADFPVDHPVAAAMHGQSLLLPLAMPLQVTPDGNATPLAAVTPTPDLWVEPEWRPLVSVDPRLRRRMPRFDEDKVPSGPVPVMAATATPAGGRLLVVGSGNWLRTAVADAAVAAGGDRMALAHPGNHELMMVATSWLSGLDDRLARGALSQEVGRLGSLSDGTRRAWGWVLLGGWPATSLAMGLVVWLRRRS